MRYLYIAQDISMLFKQPASRTYSSKTRIETTITDFATVHWMASRTYSSKTRIETRQMCRTQVNVTNLPGLIPAKQGLKLT